MYSKSHLFPYIMAVIGFLAGVHGTVAIEMFEL